MKYLDLSANRVTLNYLVQSNMPVISACSEELIYADVSEGRLAEVVNVILSWEE